MGEGKNSLHPMSLTDLIQKKQELEAQELLLIEKSLRSENPSAIVQAQNYIKGLDQKKQDQFKAFTFAPESDFYSGLGYKHKPTSVTYDLLRQMAKTPQIASIIQTRIDQSMNFSQFSTDVQKSGWSIRKRLNRFADGKEKELSDVDKRNIESLVNWIEKGGIEVSEWEGDDWDESLKKIYRDSWTLDQGAMEVAWLRKGTPYQYQVIDGGSIRLAQTYDDREYHQEKELQGYYPKYVQVWRNQVYKEFYPWELCLGMRNKTSNLYANGYSESELETLIRIITGMLNALQYNANFFTQGSNPKGLLNIKGNVDQTKVEEFKQGWRATMSGTSNSHKLAVLAGTDVQWVNMAMNNKDMEFNKWNEFLTVLACTQFRIDPDEVGFHLEGSKGMFGQDGQKERIRHSREKGLEPFLRYWQTQFDKYLVNPLSGGKYEFYFTGIDPEDEELSLERDIKILTSGGMSIQDFFLKYSNKELNKEKDIILNQIYLQYKQMDMSGSPQSNEAVDQMTGEPEGNPFKQYEDENDPFAKALSNYIGEKLKKDE